MCLSYSTAIDFPTSPVNVKLCHNDDDDDDDKRRQWLLLYYKSKDILNYSLALLTNLLLMQKQRLNGLFSSFSTHTYTHTHTHTQIAPSTDIFNSFHRCFTIMCRAEIITPSHKSVTNSSHFLVLSRQWRIVWILDHTSLTVCYYLLAITPVSNYTASQRRHKSANNLPHVVMQQRSEITYYVSSGMSNRTHWDC